jgi:hypothetical protein
MNWKGVEGCGRTNVQSLYLAGEAEKSRKSLGHSVYLWLRGLRHELPSLVRNSILYYLCAESTDKRSITDTAQSRYR